MAKSDKKIIIYCEGLSEPEYFDEFKTKDEDTFDYTTVNGDGGSRQDIVETANNKWNDKINIEAKRIAKKQRKPQDEAKRETSKKMEKEYEKWLVMDHDGNGQYSV